jgi:hypothetical protein
MKKSPPPFGISGSAVWKGEKNHKSATKMVSILKIVVKGWDGEWEGVGWRGGGVVNLCNLHIFFLKWVALHKIL